MSLGPICCDIRTARTLVSTDFLFGDPGSHIMCGSADGGARCLQIILIIVLTDNSNLVLLTPDPGPAAP